MATKPDIAIASNALSGPRRHGRRSGPGVLRKCFAASPSAQLRGTVDGVAQVVDEASRHALEQGVGERHHRQFAGPVDEPGMPVGAPSARCRETPAIARWPGHAARRSPDRSRNRDWPAVPGRVPGRGPFPPPGQASATARRPGEGLQKGSTSPALPIIPARQTRQTARRPDAARSECRRSPRTA